MYNNLEKQIRTIIEVLIDSYYYTRKARKSIAPGKSWVTKLINKKGEVITSRMVIIGATTVFYIQLQHQVIVQIKKVMQKSLRNPCQMKSLP